MSMFIELEPGDKEILILVPEFAIDRVRKTYIEPLKNIPKSKFLIGRLNFSIEKPTVAIRKDYMDNILKGAIEQYGIKKILVADGEYFKTFTKQTKADVHLGYELPLRINKNISVMYIPNFFRIFYQPEIQDKITFVLNKLNDMYAGAYIAPGEHIIHSAKLITLLSEIQPNLDNLKQYPKLTADIETFSLKHNTSGIASIAFAWDEHNGIAIQIDNGTDSPDEEKRALLRQFFTDYSGTFIWHNISFDAYALIYQLWMKNQTDIKGLLEGMSIMLKNWEDTRLITYLATNSCSRVSCALKDLAQEFGGNYAFKEIRNVAKALKEDKYTLLTYNLKDALCTWYVYKKYYPKMLSENQNDIYESIFKPAIKDIIQMQLTGLPLNMERVKEVKDILKKDRDLAIAKVNSCNIIQEYNYFLNEVYVQKKNAQYKQKQITLADAHEVFNPMSSKQKAELLYNFCGLVPEEFTNTGQPSTDSEALTNLLNKTDREDIKTLLSGLLELSEVVKILNTFIIAFEKAIPAPDGWHYLCGNFNLGGTVSGRLSSNGPNLQNLPATGTKYAKLIKSCFQAPKDKLFIGLDYASLEDRISALTTRDPNKLRIYIDGLDSHAYRAASYFPEEMPDVMKELEEIKKPGKIFKVTFDDGSVKYFNEQNPEFIRIRSNYEG